MDDQNDDITAAGDLLQTIRQQLGTLFIGQEALVEQVLVALVANGHVLVESVPGLGKTLLVKAVARLLGLETNRIQFTPDLMPSDITGSHIFDLAERRFVFRHGPVFTQFLLADEFNRAPAKTHAALLEAMQEQQVTLDGQAYPLGRAFLVMATQNPIENEGTYNLPEAQLDRFLFQVRLDYPAAAEEIDILRLFLAGDSPDRRLADLQPVCDLDGLLRLQELAGRIDVHPSLLHYINQLVRATRSATELHLGASPRAGIALLRAGRALALLRGRAFVTPDDIVDIALPAMRHRVILSPEAEVQGRSADAILLAVCEQVPVPRGIDGELASEGSAPTGDTDHASSDEDGRA
mgnify:CR=1 FL=1